MPYIPGAETTHDVAVGNIATFVFSGTMYYVWTWNGALWRVPYNQVPAPLQAIMNNAINSQVPVALTFDANGKLIDAI